MYAIDATGNRVVCPHPKEFWVVPRVTGMSYKDALAAGRTGFSSHCVCLDCLAQFDLDLERDARHCPKCSSPKVNSADELVDKPCPRCKSGKVERIPTGMMS
jgi:hypothetical protein